MPAHRSVRPPLRRELPLVNITFVTAEGQRTEASGKPGMTLLHVGQGAGMPLEGTCEGQMACSTCHVIIDRGWFDRMPEPSADEEDMLDLAAGVTGTSRLSCQVVLGDELDGLVARIPDLAHNMQVR